MFRLESLEPRLLLSGDPVLAELARWVADDGSASDAEELSVIIQEIDLAAESEIMAGNGSDESANGGQTVAWPAGWAIPANHFEINVTAKQIRFSESGQVDLLSLVTSLVGQALGNSETGEDASHTSAEGSGQEGGQTNGGVAAVTGSISSEQLNGFLEKAIEVLSTTDSELADRLADISFQVADLADGVIAEIRGNVIYIDVTAAGHGWALDSLFEHDSAAVGESHAAVTAAGSDSESGKQQPTQDMFEELAASQGQDDATGNEQAIIAAAVTVGVSESSDNWRPAAAIENSGKAAAAGRDANVAADAVAQQSFASDQFQAASNPLPGQNGQGTLGDNGATPGNSPSDLLRQVLDLVGLATGLQSEVGAGDGASGLAIGVVAASQRLQESNRSARSELRKDNSKTVNSGETASDQGSQATEIEVRIIAEGGDDAAPRGPPAIEEIQSITEDDVSDTAQGSSAVSLLYDEEVLETATSDTEMSRAPPTEDEQPRAPPTVADMPRAPPVADDSTDELQSDGIAVDSDIEIALATGSSQTTTQNTQTSTQEDLHQNEADYLLSTGTPDPASVSTTVLTEPTDPRLAAIVTEAIQRWTDSGLIPAGADLSTLTFVISNLPGDALAQAVGTTITIDTDANGFGWFIDLSPSDDFEFDGTAPAGVDLLTVVMHEIGHVLGFEHGAAGVAGLMVNQLGAGERHLPGEADMVLANGAKLNDVITAILNRFDPANPPTGINATFTTSAGDIPNIVTIGATLSGGVDLQLEGLTLTFSELVHTASGWTGEVLVESEAGILLPGGPDIVITDDDFTSATHVQSVNRVITGGADVTEEVDVSGLGIGTHTIDVPDGTYLVDFTVTSLGGPLNVGDEILVMQSNEAGFNDADPDDSKTITVVGFYFDAGGYHVLVSYNFDPGSAASWTGGSVIAMDDSEATDDLDLNAVSGTIQLALGDNSSVLNFDSINAAAVWPTLSWLVSEIEVLKLEFADFRGNDSDSALRMDTNFVGIDTGNATTNALLAGAVLFEGSNSVVFNMDLLAKGTPEVDLDFFYALIPLPFDDLTGKVSYAQSAVENTTGISGGFKLEIPGVFKIGAGFIYKEVGLDSNGVITTDSNATVETITYLAIRGFMEVGGKKQEGPLLPGAPPLPKVGGFKFGVNFAISELGPLQFFIYSDVKIPVDPASGLTITELRGGIRFSSTIEDLQLRDPLKVDTTNGVNTAVASGNLEAPVKISLTLPGHTLRVGDEFRIVEADDPDLESGAGNFVVTKVEGDVITYLTGGNGTESNPLNYTLTGNIEVKKISISDPFDLRDPGFNSTSELSLAEWEAQLDRQVAKQAGADNIWEALFGAFVIEAGATLDFAPRISSKLIEFEVDLLLGVKLTGDDLGLELLLNGTVILGKKIELSAKLYADLSDFDNGAASMLFLAELPEEIVGIEPLVVIYADVTFETLVNGLPQAIDAASGLPPGIGTDVTAANITDLSGGSGPWEVTFTLDSTALDTGFSLGDSIVVVGSGPDSFNGTYIVSGVTPGVPGVTPGTVSFVIGSVVVDGGVDVNRDGIISALDEGTLGTVPVIAGLLDIDKNGIVDANDDGEVFNVVVDAKGVRLVVPYAVIDGYIDVDGDEVVNGDPGDAVVIGEDPGIWADGFGLTRAIVAGGVDVNGDGTVSTLDDGTLGGFQVIDGLLDINRDGSIGADDDGQLINVVINSTGNRQVTSYNVIDGHIDIDGDISSPLLDPYTVDVDDNLALNDTGTGADLGGYWTEAGLKVANQDDLGDGLRITINGGVDLNIPLVTTLSLSGSAMLDFTFGGATDARIDFEFDMSLSETNIGNIGTANGKFAITMDDTGGLLPEVEIWGAALLSTDFAFLQKYGLFIGEDTGGVLLFNNTAVDKAPIELINTDGATVKLTPTAQTFAFRLDASIGLRIDFNANNAFEESEQLFLLEGTFVFSFVANAGLDIVVFTETDDPAAPLGPATLEIGPANSPYLKFNVFGFLAIRGNGIAANMVLSLNTDGGSFINDLVSIDAQFVLVLNTTGTDISFDIPAGASNPSQPTGLTVNIARAPPSSILDANLDISALINGTAWTLDSTVIGAPYILIHLGGTDPNTNPNASLNLGPFSLKGQFSFLLGAEVDPTTHTVTPLLEIIGNFELDISIGSTSLFNLQGDAFIRFDNNGLVAAINMTQRAGASFPGADLGFTLNTSFRLEINTTGAGFDHDRSSATPDIAPGFRLHMDGSMIITGVLTIQGTFDLSIDNDGVQLAITGHFDLLGIRADLAASATLTEQGFILDAQLTLATPQLSVLAGLFNIQGTFILKINTISGSAAVGIQNANVNLMGLVMSGSITIGIDAGQFYIFVPGTDPLTLNFFNVATLKVFGSFNYDENKNNGLGGASGTNAFFFSAVAELKIGEEGVLGVKATMTLTLDSSKGAFSASIDGTAWIAFIEFNAVASIRISGTSISLYLSVSVAVTPGFWFWDPWNGSYYVQPVRVSYSHTFNIGSITPPDKIVPPVPDPPVLAHVDNGILYLHIGDDSGLRDPNGDWNDEDVNESFRVTHVSGIAGNEEVLVDAFGFQKKFTGISKVVVTNAGSGDDIIDIATGVLADAELHGGTGNDRISYLGSGRAMLFGDDDNDFLTGGSGGTLVAPDMLNGGKGDDRLQGGSGYSDLAGEDGNDTLIWDQASGAELGTIDGGNDTGTGFRDTLLVLAGNAGDAAAVSAALNGNFTVSFGADLATAAAIEGVILDLMGGSDSVTLNDVSATTLTSVIVRLGQNSAGTDDDGKQDSIVLQASTGTDNILLQSTSQMIDVFDNDGNVAGQVLQESIAMRYNGQVNIAIEQSDAAGGNLATGDLLTIYGNGGNDTIDASLVTSLLLNMQFILGNDGGSILGSANADLIEVNITGDTTGILNLDGKGGGDNYIVNLLGGNTETEITINDTGAGGTDTVVVNGTAGSEKISITGAVFKQGSNTETLNYSGLETFIVNTLGNADEVTIISTHAGTTIVNSGDGEDIIAVQSVSGATTINTGADTDQVNVGSNASINTNTGGTVNAINALLTINGGTGTADVLDVDDSGDAVANTDGQLTTTNLTGLGMSNGIAYSAIEDLTIHLGSANDEFLVISTIGGRTTINGNGGSDTISLRTIAGATYVNTQADSDRINVGSNATAASNTGGTINGIGALLTVNGGTTGTDIIDVDDSGDNTANTDGMLTGTNLTGLGMSNGIVYSAVEDLNIWLGTGTDTFYIDSTHTGTTQLYAGDGNATTGERDDTVAIRSISGATTVHGQGGNDGFLVNVEYDGAVLPLVGVGAANDMHFTRTHENNLGAVLNLHGEGDSDYYTVNLAGTGNALVNVHDLGDATDGDDTLVVNGADENTIVANQLDDTFLLRRDFVALLNGSNNGTDFDQVERVNYDANINAGLFVNGLAGNDAFFADDNSSLTTLDGGIGDDSFQIGQIFGTERTTIAANIDPDDTFDTTQVIIGVIRNPLDISEVIFNPSEDKLTNEVKAQIVVAISNAPNGLLDGIAYVSDGVSYDTTVLGGEDNDSFSVYHNKAALQLEGQSGNDDFIVRAFVVLDGAEQGNSAVIGGIGEDSIQYAINAPVSIDGGDGFDTIVVLGTPFNDNFVVTDTGVFGAGLSVSYENVESVELDALEGDDTIYVLSTNASLVTTIIGGQGNDTINVMGDVVKSIVTDDPGDINTTPVQNLDRIQGPLVIEGGALEGRDRTLAVAVVLPGELNPVSDQESLGVPETDNIDILNVFHTDNGDADSGALSYRETGIANTGLALTGFGMGGDLKIDEVLQGAPVSVTYGGGVTYNNFEIVEVLLGSGDETLTISATADDAITAVHGGGGDDTITITGRGNGPLVVYGDTSEDGVRYSNDTGEASEHGSSFVEPGEDIIDASQLAAKTDGFTGVVIFGGPKNDRITGSQGNDHLAGGSGDDMISGQFGNDHIYGDSSFNVDLLLFAQDQVTPFDPETPTELDQIEAMFSVLVTATAGADSINGDAGDDIIVGDHGVVTQSIGIRRLHTTGEVMQVETTSITNGAGDTIYGNAGNDIVFGGTGADAVYGGNGSANSPVITADADVLVGDNGELLLLDPNASGPLNGFGTLRTTDTTDATGSADTIEGNEGDDIILGGIGGDSIAGNDGNDIILGDNGMLSGVAYNGASIASVNEIASELDGSASLGDSDTISGNAGNDIVIGGAAGDSLVGGNGVGNAVISGDDFDIIIGDNATLLLLSGLSPHQVGLIRTSDTDTATGGNDWIEGNEDDDVLLGGVGSDQIDGNAGDDLVIGDNARLEDLGVSTSPRYRALLGTQLYGETPGVNDGEALVDRSQQFALPSGGPKWAGWTVTLDDGLTGLFGNDYLAGGADNDTIFGQRGDDTIQGDGSIATAPVSAERDATTGLLVVEPSFEAVTDGDDYIEGNAGSDTLFGNLGQDDIIGGSSDLFGLNSSAQRADAADIIFGGAGTDIARNDLGQATLTNGAIITEWNGHSRDADVIVGDNGRIFRLIDATTGDYLEFSYDQNPANGEYEQRGDLRIKVRAVEWLDYTPGRDNFDPTSAGTDIGAADEIHGESGDDVIYGMTGGDVLFGEGQDDDLIGGYGNDWISGGTGSDGVLGDDGRIYTSRNTVDDGSALLSEPLYGIQYVEVDRSSNTLEIGTPGDLQQSFINTLDELKKSVNLTPFNVDPDLEAQDPLYEAQYADDIIYGGLGSDFLHGGAGDDAISGAEALPEYYAAPVNSGNVLRYGEVRDGEFAAYNEFEPLRRILVDEFGVYTDDPTASEFLLNFDAFDPGAPNDPYAAGTGFNAVATDGDDRIFGDLGNDWLVGGSGKDHLYGGRGNDLLNADDDHDTTINDADPYANDLPDTHPSYEDIAYGGAGRDVLIANTGGDRLIDWVGEFNSYLVPFAPFGAFTISRSLQPQLMEYLYDLSEADGADQTRAADTGADALRNGEPNGELGLVMQKDFDWKDQTGAPDDIQPGNIPGGARDVVRKADFNNGNIDGFVADSGLWSVESGRFQIAPETPGADAVSVFYVDSALPGYFEMTATINAGKPTAGLKSNAYLIFDYLSPTDFKFAGINISTDKLEMGHRTADGWIVDEQSPAQLKPGKDYNVLLALNGTVATLVVNNSEVFSHVYAVRTDIYGVNYGLNAGMVGIGAQNSVGTIDNVAVQVLPPELTLDESEDFADGVADRFTGLTTGYWEILDGRYNGAPLTAAPFATSVQDVDVGAAYLLRLDASFSTQGVAGLVFDQYSANDFKFAAISAATNEVMIGHYTERSGWQVDAAISRSIEAGREYNLEITLRGTTISVVLDGQAMLGYAFNAPLVDGASGVLTGVDGASFDSVRVQTSDPAYFDPNAVAASVPVPEINPVATYTNSQPAGIPDRGVLISTIEVTDTFALQDINVELNISHTHLSDLRVVLVSASGIRIELFNGIGGSNDNFTATLLDDEATGSILAGAAPYTGSFRPTGDLALLEGEQVNGTWTLEVYDQARREIGTLDSWSLIVTRGDSLLASGTPAETRFGQDDLTEAQLAGIVEEAVQRWSDSGLLDADQLAVLNDLNIEIANLPGASLGLTTADTIYIDSDAAGFGWFVDQTPDDDAEFADPDGDGLYSAVVGDSAEGRMDLLTVVLHEIGHVLGMDHTESGDSPLMSETLAAGDRVIHITSTEEVTTVAGSNDAADTGSDLSLRLLQTANEHYYRANRIVGVDYPDGHKRVTWSLLSL